MSQQTKTNKVTVAHRSWFAAHKWLLMRRSSQLLVLGLFLLGPVAGIWVIKGNLSSSLLLETIPMTDPYLLLQVLLTQHLPETTAFIGAAIVIGFYLLFGGRLFCSWVCPVNIVTDLAAWLQNRLGYKPLFTLPRSTRFWVLAMTLLLSATTGVLAWEMVNPVTAIQRGLIFGVGMGWLIIIAILLLDTMVSKRAWCGHLCPVGAFYSMLGHITPLRVDAVARSACDDCMDCYVVCPEPQIIKPVLKGVDGVDSSTILSTQCTNCGRCIDVCGKEVFQFNFQMIRKQTHSISLHKEVTP